MDAIGSARYLDVVATTRPVEKGERHKVGQVYWCAYWNYLYKVVALDSTRVTVHTPVDGQMWTHSTPLDRRDRVVI